MYLIEEIVHAHLNTHKHPKKESSDTSSKTSSNVNIVYSSETIDGCGHVCAPKWKAHEEK